MDQAIRNRLRGVVTQCRKLLEDSTSQALQGRFGIYASRKKGEVQIEEEARMAHLTDEDRSCRQDLRDHLGHIQAIGYKPSEALEQLVREISFTHLNRLCAYKMMESRGLIREAVSRGLKSQGFFFYLSDHPEDERLHNGGGQETAYRNFLDWLGGTFSQEIGVLFDPDDPANRIYPPQRVLDEALALINDGELKDIWSQDETIGWIYQYFTPKELRDKARKESQAPRNSYELAFRNQFFTPRYVVEFLTDNTLGRIWYEIRKGKTVLKDRCRYLVRRPTEIFLKEGEEPPAESKDAREDLSQEELLKQPIFVLHRPKKDPREIKILDPACGSGHFLLYCFDLLQVIYVEAWGDPDSAKPQNMVGPDGKSPAKTLSEDYETIVELQKAVPGLILKYNLHGIDIDLRATQIAALALWLRCQRAFQEQGLKNGERPKITRSNFVCAEPMPGESDMLREFTSALRPKVLGQLVELVFDKMKLAGEVGSLLKIEEEIRDAVATARGQWQKGPKVEQEELFAELKKPKIEQVQLFDVSDVTDERFWEQAEDRILGALKDYSERAENGRGFRRRLFSQDASRGFSFVDICSQKYDVALMNPPFGLPSDGSKSYLFRAYPESKEELLTAFLTRFNDRMLAGGQIGCIGNRTVFFLVNHEPWRRLYFKSMDLQVFLDLGFNVLDSLVEVACHVSEHKKNPLSNSMFIRCLNAVDKKECTSTHIAAVSRADLSDVFVRNLSLFDALPGYRFSYYAPRYFLKSFSKFSSLLDSDCDVFVGMQTSDNFRFLRLAWETPVSEHTAWPRFAKGGEYEPFWGDIHLRCNWRNDGEEVKNWSSSLYGGEGHWSRIIHHPDRYFRAGITYTRRTASAFNPRILPNGCIFGEQGPAIQSTNSLGVSYLALLSILNSRPYKLMIESMVAAGDASTSGTAARTYEKGVIGNIPVPQVSPEQDKGLAALVAKCVKNVTKIQQFDETTALFSGTLMDACRKTSIKELSECMVQFREDALLENILSQEKIEELIGTLYGLNSQDYESIKEELGAPVWELRDRDDIDDTIAELWPLNEEQLISRLQEKGHNVRTVTIKYYIADRWLELASIHAGVSPSAVIRARRRRGLIRPEHHESVSRQILSYAIGVTIGRWDIGLATGVRQPPKLPDPFDPLPICPPGMLQGPDDLPAKLEDVPSNYPLRIDWDGILVDDPGHEDDIVRRVRDVLEVIWKDRTEAIEQEACEILGMRELRDYFRKPGNGGFWMDHVKRYSKSRRKAPIYWYLRSTKGNYGLWLYYHRLDKDILFKALLNYVEPKIRLEEDRLKTFRRRKEAAGSSGREAKQIEKDMDRQEQFVSELRDFADKLRRAANLHLEPDLNDGVVLNIAPLWELISWKEAKEYWDELVDGKYEWSSIGKQLRKKGLVKG